MKFGVRECANITFKALSARKIAGIQFEAGQPVLYIDSAKTSTLEGASTTVYAQGGRGNARLIAWEGEKTLTFTVEDALLSPISFAMLSGAGMFSKETDGTVKVHMTTYTTAGKDGLIDLTNALSGNEEIATDAKVFIAPVDKDGAISGAVVAGTAITNTPAGDGTTKKNTVTATGINENQSVFVDYYVTNNAADVKELQIDAEHFAGSYYVEADTLFRRQHDGADLPAIITLPNVKIQSNFSFAMSGSGDPSTFTFTMDAFPGYTYFDNSKKVLCVLQVYEDKDVTTAGEGGSVMNGAATIIEG